MSRRLRRALSRLGATAALAAGVAAALILTRPDDEGAHLYHAHHLGALRAEGIRLQQQGNLPAALAKYREAIRIAQRHRLKPALLANRIAIATLYLTEERPEEAAKELQEAIALAREIGNRIEAITALAYLGQARRLQGRTEAAMAALREALDLAEDVPVRPRAMALFQLGEVHRTRGDWAGALGAYRDAHAVLREMQDAPGEAVILVSIGRAQAALHDAPAAARSLAEARDRLRRLGYAARAAEVEAEITALRSPPPSP